MTKGFTLFFALLVSSLALAIGLAIYDITVRELQLSNAATQSQYAVYAADMGAECALYWDQHYFNGTKFLFATSSQSTAPPSGAACNGQDIVNNGLWSVVPAASAATTTFSVAGSPFCITVTVAKTGNPATTVITSHGYNTCISGTLQLERILQVSY